MPTATPTRDREPDTVQAQQPGYTVYVAPGCSSCLRMKEFLTRSGIAFRVVDVVKDPNGRAELAKLGVRSVPVVARGDEFAYGQDIDDVARFVGLKVAQVERLAPEVLISKWDKVLEVAQSCARQLPGNALDEPPIPDRDGTTGTLTYHIFRVPKAFLDVIENGVPDWQENSARKPPDSVRTGSDLADYGATVRQELARWWASRSSPVQDEEVLTFQGSQSLHWFLERSTWHSAQHTRQIQDVLERLSIVPEQTLSPELLAGLPMPKRIWV